ncbi:hypothetical protein T05_12689 [Trichinella murrelli]|uniref:Uncharacterized protein n=1 Tax=Trichinella murrelli TaxID=144512 RepID=A0A0V0TPH9_9BILA|nr:hypothetical protein T05_12689 [Trichinella murrelli]
MERTTLSDQNKTKKSKRNKLYISILIRHAWDDVARCGIQDDFRTSRDDKRELAVLVGREPAGRGLSSPGTALALLSAASLTGAASLTTVAASLSEPAALSATPSFAMSAYVRRLRPATFTLFSVAVSSSLLLL